MITNLQLNKELINKLLAELERDKLLEEYYTFIELNKIKKLERSIENE